MEKIKFKPSIFNLQILPKILDFISHLDDGDYVLSISKAGKSRSLTQNAYFHAMVGEIAEVSGKGFDEVKIALNTEYGALAKDEDGNTIGFMLPKSVKPETLYKYTRWFDTRTINGKEFDCYMVYKETHLLNSTEMAKLIDGTIRECEQYGIETLSASEIALLRGNEV